MNAAIVSIQSLISDRLHILVDHFEIHFGEIANLHRLVQKFFEPPLFRQSLINFLPCAVLIRIDFAFSILCAAALSIDKTL